MNARGTDDDLTRISWSTPNESDVGLDPNRLLLAAQADPNVQDEHRITPLHLAALSGHALCVKLLLDHHADPFREDVDRQTPFVIAEKSGNIGCARLLQRAMAKATVNDDLSQAHSVSLTLRAGTSRLDEAV